MCKQRGDDTIERFGPAECCFHSQRQEGRGASSSNKGGTNPAQGTGQNSPAFPPPASQGSKGSKGPQ